MTQKNAVMILEELDKKVLLFGENDRYIKNIEDLTGVNLFLKGNQITLQGSNNQVEEAKQIINLMYRESQNGKAFNDLDIGNILNTIRKNSPENSRSQLDTNSVPVSRQGKTIRARTQGQQEYIELMQTRDITFAIGPAGTGKTYLAVAVGLSALLKGDFARLILTRPVVEAGESLGFLPGDLTQKIHPYLRPLFDAILDMISFEELQRLKEREIIEVAPLAYMRGRTLNNAFIILDEAQNATVSQLKMFLTRMGPTSKIVLTGDITQIDLPANKFSGLIFAKEHLLKINEIGIAELSQKDIVRHPLVKKIVKVFEMVEKKGNAEP